jgi:hypothetical protein
MEWVMWEIFFVKLEDVYMNKLWLASLGFIVVVIVLIGRVGDNNVSRSNMNDNSSYQSFSNERLSFEKPDWLEFGMKEGDVRAYHSEKPISYGNIIRYQKRFSSGTTTYDKDKEHITVYGFNDQNQLIYLNYTILFENSSLLNERNYKTYIEDYDEIKQGLIKLYGEVTQEEEIWKNERYKTDMKMLSTAIRDGHYIKYCYWEHKDYFISLNLEKGVNITYTTDKNELGVL